MFPGLLLLCPCSLSRPQSVFSPCSFIKANTFKKTPHCMLSSSLLSPFSSFVRNCVHIRTYVRFRRRLPKHQLLSLTRPLTSYIYVGSTKGNNEKRNEIYAFIVLLSMDYVVSFSIQYIFYESSWSFNKLIFPHLCCHHLSLIDPYSYSFALTSAHHPCICCMCPACHFQRNQSISKDKFLF